MVSLFIAGRRRLDVSFHCSSESSSFFTASLSSQVGVVCVFHGDSFPRKSGSSMCVTATLFLAGRGRLRVLRRVTSSHVEIIFVFHKEFIPRRTNSSSCFTTNLMLAGRICLRVSLRISSLQVGEI